ncbi:hypothetical protein [Roseomonas sp. BN140053]|uniref:hypothetical protein n=1 Tax=Roseomonas sp. BN140053 TaxID=3391898 RepID=UPI0039EC5165
MRAFFARILDALRSAMSNFTTGWDWLSDRWSAVAATRVGRAVGQAWTWGVRLPAQVAVAPIWGEILNKKDKAQAEPMADRCAAAIHTGHRTAVAKVGLPAAKCATTGAALGVAAVKGMASLPIRILRTALQAVMPSATATPAKAAHAAATQTREQEERADAAAEARSLAEAFRRVVAARARDARPPEEALAMLPQKVAAYALSLSREECAELAVARTAVLRTIVETGVAPRGVRSPQQIQEELLEVERSFVPGTDADRQARRAAVKAALRSRPLSRAEELVNAYQTD